MSVLTVWLHITNACNLHCHYCYIKKTNQSMDIDIGMSAIDTVFRSASLHKYDKIKIKYAGGEPTLKSDLIVKLHDYALSLSEWTGIKLKGIVLTNSTNLSNSLIEQIMRLNLVLSISLDGLNQANDSQRKFVNGKGSYEIVKINLERVHRANIPIIVNIVVTNQNLQHLPDFFVWLLEKEIRFNLSFYRENKFSEIVEGLTNDQKIIRGLLKSFEVIKHNLPQWSLLDSLIDKASLSYEHVYTCSAGRDYLVIDQDGNIAKCHMEIDQPITTILAKDPISTIRNSTKGVINLPVTQKHECNNCNWHKLCTGGCPQVTFRQTGRYDIKSPYCAIYKAIFPEILKLEKLRLKKYRIGQ